MLKWGKGIIGHVIRTGETVIASDVREDPRYVEGRPGTLSEIAMPIVVEQQVVGALDLESDHLDAFDETHAELLRFLCGAAAISIEKAILHRQLVENKRHEYQMKLARDIQAGLLPEGPPQLPGYDIDAVNVPNLSISGDYFDYITLPGGNVGIAIADVSGKGVPAALIMATFRAALRTQVRYESDITRIIRAVNQFLLESTHTATFVTAVFGVLEPKTGSFTYVNCGHTRPLLLHADGRTELLDRGGLLLGISADAAYEAATVRLEPADILALYTDGVVDLSGENGREFGASGLERYIHVHRDQPAHALIECIVNATRALTQDRSYPDDFTLVIVRRLPEAGRAAPGSAPAPR